MLASPERERELASRVLRLGTSSRNRRESDASSAAGPDEARLRRTIIASLAVGPAGSGE